MKPSIIQARQSLAKALRLDDVPGSLIFLSCCDCLDDPGHESEWLDFEPKTVQLEIRDKLGINVSPEEFDRLMAARTVVMTDLAFTSLPSFKTLICGLDSDAVSVDTPYSDVIPPSVLCAGLMEMVLLYPPSESETFSNDILAYVKEDLKLGGLVSYPKIIENLVGAPVYNEAMIADPDSMTMQADRVEEVQDSIDDWLDNWIQIAEKILFANGTKEEVIKMMQSFKSEKNFTPTNG